MLAPPYHPIAVHGGAETKILSSRSDPVSHPDGYRIELIEMDPATG
jgi:hypothetical protein